MPKRGPQRKFDSQKKWCNRCKKWLPLGAFGENRRTASGKAYYCKPCHSTYCHQFWTSVKAYEHLLKRDFGLTPQGYLAVWRAQEKACPVCRGELTLYNRQTVVDIGPGGKARGLLCADCKAGLDKLKGSLELLGRAMQYLTPEAPACS